MKSNHESMKRLMIPVVVALLATSVVWEPRATALGPTIPNVAGTWEWQEHSIAMGPAEGIMEFFGNLEPEGPTIRVICDAWGTLSLNQNGSAITGSAIQDGACITQGGQVTPQTPFPPFFTVTGSITGKSMHLDAELGQGVACSYRGSMTVTDGVATNLNLTGSCDVPVPFHPSMNKSISFDATRL